MTLSNMTKINNRFKVEKCEAIRRFKKNLTK